jgi:CRP-like cAMP-binding protein
MGYLRNRPQFRTSEDQAVLLRFASSNRLCKTFPKSTLPRLVAAITYQYFSENSMIFVQGEEITASSCVYVILEGQVGIYVQSGPSATSLSTSVFLPQDAEHVTTLSKGAVFGEAGALGSAGVRTASAVATTACHLMCLTRYGSPSLV